MRIPCLPCVHECKPRSLTSLVLAVETQLGLTLPGHARMVLDGTATYIRETDEWTGAG